MGRKVLWLILASTVLGIACNRQPDEKKETVKNSHVETPVGGQGEGGRTPLHLAALRSEDAGTMRQLLENGADVNVTTPKGNRPLHLAAWRANVEGVSLLLEHGAEADARAEGGYAALHFLSLPSAGTSAREGIRSEIARLLIAQGADVNARGNDRRTPLHVAARWNCDEVARCLLQHGADPGAVDRDGYTPLGIAQNVGNETLVEILNTE